MAPQNAVVHHQKAKCSKFQNHFSERNNSEMNAAAANQLTQATLKKQTAQTDSDALAGSLLPSSILSHTQQQNTATDIADTTKLARKNNQSQAVNTYGGYDANALESQQVMGSSARAHHLNKKLNSHTNSMTKLEKK